MNITSPVVSFFFFFFFLYYTSRVVLPGYPVPYELCTGTGTGYPGLRIYLTSTVVSSLSLFPPFFFFTSVRLYTVYGIASLLSLRR